MRNRTLLSSVLLLVLGISLINPAFGYEARAQGETSTDEVLALLEGMTPEERVGQLFLISFEGAEIDPESEFAELLANYPIGGVVLRAENDNFVASPETIHTSFKLISDLQKSVWDASRQTYTDTITGETLLPVYIPLLVGITQEGGGPPNDQIISGLTPLPSPMAIGATWNTELAAATGEILGRELAALGINLYLGPSLDVLAEPNPDKSGDMGTRSFGGNPYWVGEMGKDFISGLHIGSLGKMLVVAKHFPGRGSADRSPAEEIVTIRKTFEELKENELAPFSAVALDIYPDLGNMDALLISHIRYEGFQGNIRPTTRPVSLDEQSLTQILTSAPFDEWRAAGGLTISDDLGSRAIHEFYAPGNDDFFAHLVARDAFLAGNDLLYLGNIISSDSSDTFTTITKTHEFFTQKYREDPAFATRVDESLIRILTQKIRLYPSFSLNAARPSLTGLEEIGQNQQATFDVAQNAATLISPSINDLDAVLPAPPVLQERIIFITDTQTAAQCSLCEQQYTFSASALPEAVLRLYGEGGGEQIIGANISAYSFEDFLISGASEEISFFENNLRQADWVIISLASFDSLPIMRKLLADNQTILREKNIILFSFSAPYFLDATDISKLTAYYGLYSYAPPFLDAAARLLFKELTPVGASPVSIPGIGYDLNTATQPDPDQLLTLNLALPLESFLITPEAIPATPAPTPIPMFLVGDTLAVRTGVILDHNGRTVPDNTLVVFSLVTGGESGIHQEIETGTVGGIARANFQLDQTGLLDIRVESGEANVSETLRLDISDEGIAAAVTIIPPNSEETPTTVPAISPTPERESSSPYLVGGKPRLGFWFISFFLWIFGAWLAFLAGKGAKSVRWGLRWALCVLLGGLFSYNYFALNLSGASWVTSGGIFGVLAFILLGEVIGWLVGWLWLRRDLGE